MSQALRKIAGNASKCNCTVIFLNQLRHKVRASARVWFRLLVYAASTWEDLLEERKLPLELG